MIGDVVKVYHKDRRVKTGEIKGYKPYTNSSNDLLRDPRGHLQGMINSRPFEVGTIGVIETEVEKVAPQGLDAVGVRIRFGAEDVGEVWWFPLENLEMR
jgi:hypothetical protein